MAHLKLILAFFLATLFAPAMAHAALKTQIFVDRQVFDDRGALTTEHKPATKVVPGDTVTYQLTFHNDAVKPAEGVTITNPVPKDMTYAGTVDVDAPLVSIDGVQFAPLANLSVRKPDGAVAPAQLSDVTAVRWTFAKAVPAGGETSVSFRALLK